MKTETKVEHTPGPWHWGLQVLCDGVNNDGQKINPRTIEDYYAIEAGQKYWSEMDNSKGFSLVGYMSEANARVIAAAPEMLKILEQILADYDRDKPIILPDRADEIQAAINKARGK